MDRLGQITRRLVMTAGLAAIVALGSACTGHGLSRKKEQQVEKQVRTRGLIIGFEGLQPFSGHRADDLTKKVAKDVKLAQAATSGNASVHLPLVAAAYAHGQPVYIVGYSLGGNEARKLAEKCQRTGYPVDILFLLDPGAMGVFRGTIPSNVRKVVFYQSGTYDSSLRGRPRSEFLEDASRTEVEFEDMSRQSHLNLPSHVAKKIRDQIKYNSVRPAARSG
ncbi:MAG: hypothetical protein PHU85_10495 [Phycisphaerae bacterium]|nr:hypothetical protein [Phycisphaerae bacterium]